MPWTLYINPVSSLGYGKLILTIVKFIPVVNWNYQRKSTEGWSIFGVLSDLVGGACSFISGLLFTHHGINMGKLGLALISIFFDLIFTVQHYCIYPVSERSKPEDKFHEMNEVEMPEFPENKLQNVQETEKGTTESKLTETPEK